MNRSTLLDLNLISENAEADSFLSKYDFTKNDDSKLKLKEFLIGDILSKSEIKSFQETLKYVMVNIPNLDLGINNEENYYLKEYFKYDKVIIRHNSLFDKTLKFIGKSINHKPYVNLITSGVTRAIIFLHERWKILRNIKIEGAPLRFAKEFEFISSFITKINLDELSILAYPGDLPFLKILELDNHLRVKNKDTILKIFNFFYEIEALVSISKAAKKYNLTFPEISDTNDIIVDGLFHPFVVDCIKNDFKVIETENLLFLTGPNMSGKSTFLKSIGVTVYLAMRGFPVPAERASVPIFDEIIININTQDDIFKGDSYFLSELKKVKEIAVKLDEGKKCFVIFDELFKGTNFIDSKECSKLALQGFAKFTTSKFIISTHMVELYEEMEKHSSVRSIYLETLSVDNIPSFTHKLKNGVSHVRLGLYLLEKEGIKDLLFNKHT